jgi:thiol-disulfide isomerase/thioredoxin
MSPHKSSFPRAAVVALLLLMLPAGSFAEWRAGDALPDLASFELEGKLPDELRGRVILLDFWASWCGPCKASFPAMDALAKEFGGRGLTVIAVGVDEKRENLRQFVASAKVSFTVVRDARHKLVAAADVRSMPASFLVDRAGKVRFVHAGFDRERTPREYAREIVQLLKEPNP